MAQRADAQRDSAKEGFNATPDNGTATSGRRVVRRIGTLTESMRGAGPATADDVTILRDGRRLDTREKVLEFIREFEVEHPHLRRDSMSIDQSR